MSPNGMPEPPAAAERVLTERTAWGGVYRFHEVAAPPQRIGGRIVTPIAVMHALRVGPIAWAVHWPSAVLVQEEGREERIPVLDVTRLLVWGLFALTVLALLVRVAVGVSKGAQEHGRVAH